MINNILVLDGGGIRGVLTARVMSVVEDKLCILSKQPDARLADFFDFFVGTSAGGLLACLYVFPNENRPRYSAKEVENMYIADAEYSFKLDTLQKVTRGHALTKPKYPAHSVEEIFKKHCGDVMLADLLKPYMATAYDIIGNQMFLFRQYMAQNNPEENFYMRDVCRATTSAPIYFPAADVTGPTGKKFLFIDGGVYARNPSLLAYAEMRRLFPGISSKKMSMLSVGAGEYNEKLPAEEVPEWGKLEWGRPLINLMSSCNVKQSERQMDAIFLDNPGNYLRIDPKLPNNQTSKIDLVTEQNIDALLKLADDYIRDNEDQLDAFVEKIYTNKNKPIHASGGRILDMKVEPYWQKSYPARTPRNIDVQTYESLLDLAEDASTQFSDRIAFEEFGSSMTYRSAHTFSLYLSAWLQQIGKVKKGDRVALMMPNCSQYALSLFATHATGGVVVNINPLYTVRELENILRDAKPKVIIIWNGSLPVLQKCNPKLRPARILVTGLCDMAPLYKRIFIHALLSYNGKVRDLTIRNGTRFRKALRVGATLPFYRPKVSSDNLAFIQYTGGTTGQPKGVMLTHRNLVANILQCRHFISKDFCDSKKEQRVILTALPLYHIYALTVNCYLFFHLGALSVLIANPRDMNGLIKTMRRYAFHGISGVNTLFKAMLAHPDFSKLNFEKLILSMGGGMPVQESVATEWKKITGNILSEGYGLTEASPVVTINPANQKKYNGSIGLPVPSTSVAILDPKTLTPLPQGETGLLFVSGPQVMEGYWKNPEATAEILSINGWLNTGDLGYMDEKGYIYLVDRIKDLILVSGFNVYPGEIEAVLDKHAAVHESGCTGIKNEQGEEEVTAFVVLKENQECTEEDLEAHCRKFLTGYKIPSRFVFVDETPKTAVGKILRRALPALLQKK